MVYSIIQKSQLEGANRIDAEYYQPEYREKIKKLSSTPIVKLGDVAYITDGEHGSPIWDENSGIKYYSAQHVQDGIIDSSDAQTISKIIDDKNKRSRLQKGDILISTVGTIGFAGLVTEDLLPANIDRHVGRICLKSNTLDPEFIVAFLNSSYGRFQSFRNSTGNVQLNLFIEKIKEFLIPKNNNSQVSQLVKLFLREKDISEKLYTQAKDLLLEELGLSDFQVEDDLSFVVNFSDLESSSRIDPDFFQPKYERLIKKIKEKKSKPLTYIVENVPAKFDPLKNPDNSYRYVELSNINSSLGIIDGSSDILGKEAPSRAKRVLREGDVIVSSIGGSLNKVALVDKENEGSLASTGFFQFRSDKILPEVLLVSAKGIVLQMQLERQVAGTILAAVSSESLKNIVIPVLPKETQQKIADLVRQSHEARKKSKELLEEAKRKVEEMIEKGGN